MEGSSNAPPPAAAPPDLSHLAGQPAAEALPRLLEVHGGRLHSLALKFCGTPEDAEDLVQETFLLAFRNWGKFRGDSSPTTWLYTIAARACQRRNRRRSGEPRTLASLDALTPFGDGPVADLEASGSGPLNARLRREARERVERALVALPHHYRLALVLKDLVELSVSEVAQILGLKEATVKTRVHRARLRLRDELADSLPQKEAPPPRYSQRVCLDLLKARQEALDRGVPFPVPQGEVCERCESLFSTLELAKSACADIGRGELPPALGARLLEEFGAAGN